MLKAARRASAVLRRRWRWVAAYAALLALSHLVVGLTASAPEPARAEAGDARRVAVRVPRLTAGGEAAGADATLSVLVWDAVDASPGAAPVVMLHGSPGYGGRDFSDLAPLLAATGRTVYAPDRPGWGESSRWWPDYSLTANARVLLAALDRLGIERAHLVGWSQGGGATIEAARMAPERVASLTMMSSIGAQEAEGSGSYAFEHAKYAAGYVLLVALPEIVPHFGLLGPRWVRHSFIRDFWDSDQRPMKSVLSALRVPTLILHGRSDFLVPSWGAELHHGLVAPSSLVMMDAGHLLPWRHADETAQHLRWFLGRHDAAGAAPLRFSADFAPTGSGGLRAERELGPFSLGYSTPWWLVIVFIILATFITEDATVIGVGILIAAGRIDPFVGLAGCYLGIVFGDGGLWLIGRVAGRRALHWPFIRAWAPEESLDRWGRWFDRNTVYAVFISRFVPGLRLPTYVMAGLLSRHTHYFLFWAALAALVWTPLLLVLAVLIGPSLLAFFEGVLGGPVALIVSVVVVLVAIRLLSCVFTWTGRRRLLRDVSLPFRREFWPVWIFYLPLVPVLGYLALRYGPMTFTCVNPGVPHGGGVVGESKHLIIEGLRAGGCAEVAHTHLIQRGPDPETRAAIVDDAVRNDAAFGGYPVVLKPDESQRGHGFRLVRSHDDVLHYFRDMTRDALLQAFHPGPAEVGVLWSRRPERLDGPGEIFSITRKRFPFITGDGRSTIERLIWAHPRHRMQAPVFLKRLVSESDRTPAVGEVVPLAVAGNHCQGTMFVDGADLITPDLERRIDQIARAYTPPGGGAEPCGGAFDFGRFDLRYSSDESLRRGEGFVVIELNGTMSESTNLYDPGRSVLWSYGVLFRQWVRLYRLGAVRRRAGVRPMGFGEMLRAVRDHYRGRPGSRVSD